MSTWMIYQGGQVDPHDRIDRLPKPPPWRVFDEEATSISPWVEPDQAEKRKAIAYRPDTETVERVNAAMYLRRPLMVSGSPGIGKSTLAYSIAYELGLGKVLRWPITSRANMRDGLYEYDPLARLYAASRRDAAGASDDSADEDIGQYIRLGPLGTALLPSAKPRVLLIDEIDKGDLDLPNDLLTVFEEGTFEIRELVRLAEERETVEVLPLDSNQRIPVTGGRVRCRAFPIVVMTSNAEREFPPAFLRRCIQVPLKDPDRQKLVEIVSAHLGPDVAGSDEIISLFMSLKDRGQLATDQLLNAIYLTSSAAALGSIDRASLANRVMSHLSASRLSADDD